MHVERGENKQRMRVCSAQTANAGDQSKELKNVSNDKGREEKRIGLEEEKNRRLCDDDGRNSDKMRGQFNKMRVKDKEA